MNKVSKHTSYGVDSRTQRIRAYPGEHSVRTGQAESVIRPESRSAKSGRKGSEYPSAPVWHNALYGAATAGAILAPHYLLDKSYFGIMLGVTAVALGVFLVISVLGVFQNYLPFGHHAQNSHYHRR